MGINMYRCFMPVGIIFASRLAQKKNWETGDVTCLVKYLT